MDLEFLKEITDEYGPTTRRLPSGRTELNLATMSRLLARRHKLVWDAAACEFLQRRDDGANVTLSAEQVTAIIADALQRIAACHPDEFPANELRLARIRKLVEAIKLAVPVTRPDIEEGLHRFVRECLTMKVGGSVSAKELYANYARFVGEHKYQADPHRSFSQRLAKALFKTFGKTPSNSVLRPVPGTNRMTSRVGYRGIAFAGEKTEAGEVGDAGDVKYLADAPNNPS